MLVKNIANERSSFSDIFITVGGKNKVFFLSTYPWVKLLSQKGETKNILI
jgi:hypothetical protein